MAGKKLLVADDSLTIQKVIRLALSNEGYEIQAVSDGNDVIQQLSVYRPDVVLIDVSLPGKTAFEVKKAANVVGDLESIKFVLMSSAFEKVDESQVHEARFHGYLTKPFDPADLRKVLTDVLSAASEPISSGISQESRMMEIPADTEMPARTEIPAHTEVPARAEIPIRTAPDTPDSIQIPITDFGDEDLKSLWDQEDRMTEKGEDPFASLAPPPLPKTGTAPTESIPIPSDESDIKQLTESTLRMSGMADEFQWSIQEGGLKKTSAPAIIGDATLTGIQTHEPSIRPTENFSDLGGSNFNYDHPWSPGNNDPADFYHNAPEAEPTLSSLSKSEPTFGTEPPVPPPFEEPFSAAAVPDTFSSPPSLSMPTMGSAQSADPLPSLAPMPETPLPAPPLDHQQMEDLVKKQLQDTLEELARKILPEVAERVIKQEINRMLREQA